MKKYKSGTYFLINTKKTHHTNLKNKMKKINLKNNTEIIIREARKEDAAQLIKYVKQVADETNFLTFSAEEFKVTVEQEEQILVQHQLEKNRIYLVATLNNEIIGILNVGASHKKRLKHIGEFGMSVLKEHWRKGVGKALLTYMLDWAKETGILRKINLKVSTKNEAAIHLYKTLNFEIEGMIKRDLFVDNEFGDTYQMGLLID